MLARTLAMAASLTTRAATLRVVAPTARGAAPRRPALVTVPARVSVMRSYAADVAVDQTAPSYASRPPPVLGTVSASDAGRGGASVTLVGRTGAPFETARFGDRVRATASVAFSVGRDKTEWIPVDVWGDLADAVAGGVAKGDRVKIVGKLRASEFVDKATGAKRRSVRVVADSVARVVDGPVAAGGDWGDVSQVPTEWGAAPSAPAPPATAAWADAGAAGWPATDGGVDWGAAAAAPPSVDAAAAAAAGAPAWGAGAWEGAPLVWGAPPPPAAGGPAPWDGESPSSWGEPAASPAPAAWGAPPPPQQAASPPPPPSAATPADAKWAALFADPSSHWDNRASKRSPRAPDFKHKASGEGLWLTSRDTPAWVAGRLGELPPPRQG